MTRFHWMIWLHSRPQLQKLSQSIISTLKLHFGFSMPWKEPPSSFDSNKIALVRFLLFHSQRILKFNQKVGIIALFHLIRNYTRSHWFRLTIFVKNSRNFRNLTSKNWNNKFTQKIVVEHHNTKLFRPHYLKL
jgi:hypothetical protein